MSKKQTGTAERREELRMKARLCEKMARFDDMRSVVKTLVDSCGADSSLNKDDRHLVSIAYKNVVGERRTSWRAIYLVTMSPSLTDKRHMTIALQYRQKIEDELKAACTEILALLDQKLIPSVKDPASDVFYHKMKGDYNRYLVEVEVSDRNSANNYLDTAEGAYQGAYTFALSNLAATDPLRLGLALNYSVFLHELKEKHQTACTLAKDAYDDAIDEIDTVNDADEKKYNECRNMMNLLRENIKLWAEPQSKQNHV